MQGAGLRDFAKAVAAHWLSLMSGAPSVFLAIGAALVPDVTAKILLVAVAMFCAVAAAYFVWRVERQKVIELNARLRPRLKCAFSHDLPGCVVRTRLEYPTGSYTEGSVGATYFRLRIETVTDLPVLGMVANLIQISRDSVPIYNQGPLSLCIAPAERDDPTRKDAIPSVPEYADVLAVTDDGRIIMPLPFIPNSLNIGEIFGVYGTYTFAIVVAAPGCPRATANLRFKWAGNLRAAEMSMEKPDQTILRPL